MSNFTNKVLCFALLTGSALNLSAKSPADYEKAEAQKIKNFKMPNGFKARLWADKSQIKNPMAITFDSKGSLLLTEIHRWRFGVDDIRHRPYMLMDDILIESNADRLAMYEKHYDKHPEAHYRDKADVIKILKDSNGDGRADSAKVYADGFNDILDGPGLGIIERDGKVYYTNIPHLWMLEDSNGDGVLDKRTSLQDGFGIRMSYSGHDMHGLVWGPDGKLYWSIGDRGYSFTTKEGKKFHGPNEGAVFRCDPEGSNIEVFVDRLRNPQELQFDDYGNLFTADNDSDKGDLERINYLVEGGDAGWHAGHQNLLAFASKLNFRSYVYAEKKSMNCAWMSENLYLANEEDQPAYLLPSIGQIIGGPSGFLFNPSNSLGKDFDNKFFVNIFKGGSPKTRISMFDLDEKGAGFEMKNLEVFFTGSNLVDMDFGPDGKMYISEFNNGGYLNRDEGNIFSLEVPGETDKKEVKENEIILTSDFSKRSDPELYELLARDHQQVRLKAQFELAKRKAGAEFFAKAAQDKQAPQLQRIHGIWGLGMLASKNISLLKPLKSLLMSDEDAQVRIQCARALGDHRDKSAMNELLKALEDTHARAIMYAGIGLGRIGDELAVPAIIEAQRRNAGQDRFLQHGLVMALAGMKDSSSYLNYSKDSSVAVRMIVLLALRKTLDPNIRLFLKDDEKKIRDEAIRAINDRLIDGGAQQALASLLVDLSKPNGAMDELMHLRVINANYYLGDEKSAERLVQYASRKDLSESMVQEAVAALQAWDDKALLDNTTGLPREYLHPRADIKDLLHAQLGDLLKKSQGKLLAQLNRLANNCDFPISSDILMAHLNNQKLISEIRIGALESLSQRGELSSIHLMNLLKDKSELIRLKSLEQLNIQDPEKAQLQASKIIQNGTRSERQLCYKLMEKGSSNDRHLLNQLDQFLMGKGDREVMLEVLNSSRAKSSKDFKKKLADVDAKMARGAITDKFTYALEGGDVDRGRDVFYNHGAAQCLRCHKVNGYGADVGPDLTLIGKSYDRRYLLESIVDPGARVAPGFGITSITNKDDEAFSGTYMGEDDQVVKIKGANGRTVAYKRKDIKTMMPPMSPMPPMHLLLQAGELRDMVAYLKSLDKASKKKKKDKSSH
ncbi:HEAT repeat domain-containing protein [Lentisphaera profundi]|uniref:HEAT repeat domain-containing protein n=1 Tax=Lentisphaera profundi TaxID=1658616 RepID=A0ABY7VRK1_9BACT|nr:HEAT repeat domain-containing protein [Lentisphaera profundi]WDE95860.1 HEAT repeat domain-containing protein [Lentisphaera profundi]